jgi:hypothetical protein
MEETHNRTEILRNMVSARMEIPLLTKFQRKLALRNIATCGGVSSTHNTSECTKYEKDGTLKAEWGKKAPLKTTGKTKTVGGNAFAQMAKRMAKLEKTLKKHTKTFSCKKKRHYESSSDSDSE